jgi:hypothetical protein
MKLDYVNGNNGNNSNVHLVTLDEYNYLKNEVSIDGGRGKGIGAGEENFCFCFDDNSCYTQKSEANKRAINSLLYEGLIPAIVHCL